MIHILKVKQNNTNFIHKKKKKQFNIRNGLSSRQKQQQQIEIKLLATISKLYLNFACLMDV